MIIFTRSSGATDVFVIAPAIAPQNVCLMPVTAALSFVPMADWRFSLRSRHSLRLAAEQRQPSSGPVPAPRHRTHSATHALQPASHSRTAGEPRRSLRAVLSSSCGASASFVVRHLPPSYGTGRAVSRRDPAHAIPVDCSGHYAGYGTRSSTWYVFEWLQNENGTGYTALSTSAVSITEIVQ